MTHQSKYSYTVSSAFSRSSQSNLFVVTKKLIAHFRHLLFFVFSDTISSKLQSVNVFSAGRLSESGQDVLLHSVKFTNNVWALLKLSVSAGSPNVAVAVKTRAPDITPGLMQSVTAVLQS